MNLTDSERKLILWINLIIGIYNIYLWSVGDNLFNLLIGSLNIGVWVFFRNQGQDIDIDE
tara:strand:- start:1254 stop:1433 length:180 start_codon:yes stop_codon:yes gene_type:complete